MRSRPDRPGGAPASIVARSALALLLGPLAAPAPAAAAPAAPAAAGDAAASAAAPSVDEVRRIVAEMNEEATGHGKLHTEHSLRFKNLDKDDGRRGDRAPAWLMVMVGWLARSGRALVWLFGALLVALLAVFAWRWASLRGGPGEREAGRPPSFVNALDIRPESLPPDIGAAALALCQRGELRAALSLLYRGGLSRLVHRHRVAIGAASTEGECLQLGRAALAPAAGDYFGRLVGTWQSAVYAGRTIDASAVAALCSAFETFFPPAPDAPAAAA